MGNNILVNRWRETRVFWKAVGTWLIVKCWFIRHSLPSSVHKLMERCKFITLLLPSLICCWLILLGLYYLQRLSKLNGNRPPSAALRFVASSWAQLHNVIVMSAIWIGMARKTIGCTRDKHCQKDWHIRQSRRKKPPDKLQRRKSRCKRPPDKQRDKKGLVLYASIAILAGAKESLTDISTVFANTLALTSRSLLVEGESFPVIIDSGCTRTATGVESDFIPDSLVDLSNTGKIVGIDGGAGLKFNRQGIVRYDVVSTSGTIKHIETRAYLVPELGQVRLLSPQDSLKSIRESKSSTSKRIATKNKRQVHRFRCRYCLYEEYTELEWEDGETLRAYNDPRNGLPTFRAYRDILSPANLLALQGCISDETNQNLTRQQKLLLRAHFRLGHAGFQLVQWIGRQGWLGPNGKSFGHTSVNVPKCAACQHGKQTKTSTPTRHVQNEPRGSLTTNTLQPGELVFSDQYESRGTHGRSFKGRGVDSSERYMGGTLFCDAATGYIFVVHQEGLTAAETIQAKMQFEREALTAGVRVQTYHTDNGIYTSREFMKSLASRGQGIRLSGVDAKFQNGTAENSIKIVTQRARTMMIHAGLRWPGEYNKELWPMALSHSAYLHNHLPNQSDGRSPIELFTRTKGDYSQLNNMHPWGCPVYVLEPRLRNGQKIPKWEPRSRRGQFMGVSPLHASTVGLIRNLNTGTITPQFHTVFDDFFETVTADIEPPDVWEDLLTFNRFHSDFDDPDYQVDLADEWLDQDELLQRQAERARRDTVEITSEPRQNQNQRESIEQREPTPTQVNDILDNDVQDSTPLELYDIGDSVFEDIVVQAEEPTLQIPPSPVPTELRRSTRVRQAPSRFGYDGSGTAGYLSVKRKLLAQYCHRLAESMIGCSEMEQELRYKMALMTDVTSGRVHDDYHPSASITSPAAFKVSKTKDPDLPTYREAMVSEHRADFESAMDQEINDLIKHKTWHAVKRRNVPKHANVLPGTWVLRIKRFPDGRMRKHKARFCVRGDRQVEGVDYFEKYAPVVSWSTVRLMMCLALHTGMATRQIDFSNAFVQATLNEDVYIELPQGYALDKGKVVNNGTMHGRDSEHVLKLDKSLYGLVQAPMYWGKHLKAALERHGFKASIYDSCCYTNDDGIVILTYCDDCLFFHQSQEAIDKVIDSLRADNLSLTVEDDIFSFLGVEVVKKPNNEIELLQKGLIDKVLKTCGMKDCNTKETPANPTPLGTDTNGARWDAEWDYSSVVGMLMYLCSNSRPDIQFAVHQCARFTHCPRKSHEKAIIRICRYLQGTRDRGLCLKPDKQMKLDCYVDADFAGLWSVENSQDPVCVKSRTGYCLTLGDCPLLWVSKLQTEISLSTTEAEYIALSQAMRELIPMRAFLEEIGKRLKLEFAKTTMLHSTVFEDNNGALSLSVAPKISPRTKHIAVKYHHFREAVGKDKGIEIVKIDTTAQKADIFTKGLVSETFKKIRNLLMGW